MPIRRYHYTDDKEARPPDYARVFRDMNDAELEDEILERRGDDAYRAAALAEQERRARAGAPATS